MHELGIARGILDVVLDVAGERPVREVRVAVGALNGVVADSLAFGFQLLAEETPAAGAHLAVTPLPARGLCSQCGQERELRAMPPSCDACGSVSVALTAGRELRVDALLLAGPSPEVVAVGREVDEAVDGHTHDEAHPHQHGHQRHDVLTTGTVVAGSWPFD